MIKTLLLLAFIILVFTGVANFISTTFDISLLEAKVHLCLSAISASFAIDALKGEKK